MAPDTKEWSPLPPLVREQFFWCGEDVLPSWAGFQSRRGPYCSIDRPEPSDGTVGVSVKPADEADEAPTRAQLAAYEFLKSEHAAIAAAILTKLLTVYPDMKWAYDDAVDETWPKLPDVTEPGGFRSLMGLATVHVLSVERDGLAYVGFEFGCDWEDEHGLGVLTHRTRVLDIGHAEVSFNNWIPACDE